MIECYQQVNVDSYHYVYPHLQNTQLVFYGKYLVEILITNFIFIKSVLTKNEALDCLVVILVIAELEEYSSNFVILGIPVEFISIRYVYKYLILHEDQIGDKSVLKFCKRKSTLASFCFIEVWLYLFQNLFKGRWLLIIFK